MLVSDIHNTKLRGNGYPGKITVEPALNKDYLDAIARKE